MTPYEILELKAALRFWSVYHTIGARNRVRAAIADLRKAMKS